MTIITKLNCYLQRLLTLFLILTFVFVSAVSACNFPNIPDNQFEGEDYILSGLLTYSQWELLEPYYIDNISVPNNGLSIIKDIFPETSCHLPNKKDLKKYYPWNRNKIKTFFEDYPFLRNLLPILSFDNGSSKTTFYLVSSLEDRFQKSSFNAEGKYSFKNFINVTAKGNYIDSVARWKNRSISITPNRNTSIALGNFNYNIDNNILFGYMPYSSKPQIDPLKNWLYTNNSQFNGVKLEQGGKDKQLISITHLKEKEFLEVIKFKYNIENISFNSILSADLTEKYDTSVSASFKLSYITNRSEISLLSLINSKRDNNFPFELNIANNFKILRNNFKFTFMPQNFSYHRSSEYNFLSYRLSKRPTESSEALTFRNVFSIKASKKFYSNYSTIIALNHDQYYLKQEIQFIYNSRISLLAKYRFDNSRNYSRNYITFKSPIEIMDNFVITPSFYTYINDENYYRYKWQISIKGLFKSLTLQPLFQWSSNSKNKKSMILQLISRIKISERSRGYYRITYKPLEAKNHKIKIYLGQSFNL